jgi:hypothetical protein
MPPETQKDVKTHRSAIAALDLPTQRHKSLRIKNIQPNRCGSFYLAFPLQMQKYGSNHKI